LFELKSGRIIYNYDIPFIQGYKVKIADGNSKYFVAIQKRMAFVIDKFSKTYVAHDNFHGMNVVACHPEDDCFATGDANGKVKLWRNIFSKHAVTQEFHWHHMIVLSLAFSQSGTMLYSGGNEKVLVKWNIADKNFSKNFLPRLPGSLMQISVDSLHDKIALSVDDNSIQIINSNLMIVKVIQEMTQASIYDLGLSQNRYPAGIHLNPRNNQLVLNGRIGHLQFLSSKSLKLLYNMDISMRNSIPRQRETNIFSTEITHVATSFNWLVTVESWNDRVVTPDSRLKFWKFLEDKQTYSLHTQVEQAHMKEITCVEFSSKNDIKNLLCATAGQDKIIKIWSLEKSEDVENAKMIWLCIEQLSYKNLLVKSLNFSNDSSILAGGFGNILCLWNTKNFELKASLSAPAVFDGSINRVLINIPSNKSKNKMKKVDEILEKRKKIVDLMKQMIEDKSNDSLVKNITEEKSRYFKQKQVKKEKLNLLNKAEKKTIFNNILKINELNFNQKIQILHKLSIYYKISNRIESEVFEFMKRGIETDQQCYKRTYQSIIFLKNDDKYKMQWRFRTWNNLISKRNRKFVSVRNLLTKKVFVNNIEKFKEQKEGENFLPIKNLTQITNVFFCSDELSHLVVITTPKKLLVWNLLTLKLHGSFNIQVKFATIDPITNLLAIFTKFHELFIFSLWPYLVLHRQKNMPEIYGAIWIPREFPTSKSLNVNWQASSQLLFLNHNQELCRIRTPEDDDFKSTTPYLETTNEPTSNTPFAAMIAKKINDETTKDVNGFSKRVAVSGTGAVKDVSLYIPLLLHI
jgi:NET1-associated nuclear protein 1 (U3 small nucleolar RNA-associated protein 17)